MSYDLEEESVRAAQGGRNLNPVKNMLQKQIGGSARNSRVSGLDNSLVFGTILSLFSMCD